MKNILIAIVLLTSLSVTAQRTVVLKVGNVPTNGGFGFLPLSGGTMSGLINMGGNTVSNIGNGTASQLLAGNGSIISAGSNITISGGVISSSTLGAVLYTDTAAMLSSYYNKTAADALYNTKVNITDTAAMLGTNYYNKVTSDGRFQPLENQRLSTFNTPTFSDIVGTGTLQLSNTGTSFTQWRAASPVNASGRISVIDVGSAAGVWGTYNNSNQRVGFIGDDATNMHYVSELGYHDFVGRTVTSGSSTATNGFIIPGGTSAQILTADGGTLTAGSNITISGGTISASGSSVTLSSGTYIPTFSTLANMSTPTLNSITYLRVGNVVHVNASIDFTVTASGSATASCLMTLPVTSTVSTASKIGSLAINYVGTYSIGHVNQASTTQVELTFLSTATGVKSSNVQFQYTL